MKNKLAGSILKDIKGDKRTKADKKPASPPGKPQSKHPPIPGHEFLGAGYNAFGLYANAASGNVMANIFDFSSEGSVDQQLYDESLPQVRQNVENAFTTMPTEIKLFYAKPPTMQYLPRFEASVDFSLDGSMSSEQHSLAAHVEVEGSYGLFAAEFSARYDSSDSHLATAKFYSATARIFYYDLTMANYGADPVKFMRPTARQDLNDKSKAPEEIFENYGTHYIYALTIGSKIVFGHSVDTSKTTASYDAAAELKARYGEEGAEVGGGGGVKVTSAWEQASEGESIHVYCEGISDAQLAAIKTADTAPIAALQEGWHNPTLVDFPGTSALRPIWELCDSEERKQELQDAFAAYAKTHGTFLGANADLTPLYLVKSSDSGTACYRFSTNHNAATVDGVTWNPVDADGAPALCVFNEQKPGTVPLYEYRWSGHAPDELRRYETSRWETYLARYARAWTKVSGNPVGWVYDGLEPAPAPPSGYEDVYTYYPRNDGGAPRFLYSTDSADGRDAGGWRAYAGVYDDVHPPAGGGVQLPPDSEPDTMAVFKLGSGVHWRVPTT
jgi:MAC/Perforin domain